jgi:hypothetical protein
LTVGDEDQRDGSHEGRKQDIEQCVVTHTT